MRLTTYNIRSKYLLAGCCLSEYMERYWTYLEEGELKKAECAQKKALKLDALRHTLLCACPIIDDPKTLTITYTVTSGSLTTPYSISSITANGINVLTPMYIHSGDTEYIFRKVAENVNSLISNNDDNISVSMEVSTSPLKAVFTFVYNGDMSPIVFDASSLGTGTIVATVVRSTESDHVYDECMSNAQILKVIGKIDELCECEC